VADSTRRTPKAESYYTASEVAWRLKMAPVTIRTWLRQGRLLGTQDQRGDWRIPESELQRIERLQTP